MTLKEFWEEAKTICDGYGIEYFNVSIVSSSSILFKDFTPRFNASCFIDKTIESGLKDSPEEAIECLKIKLEERERLKNVPKTVFNDMEIM